MKRLLMFLVLSAFPCWSQGGMTNQGSTPPQVKVDVPAQRTNAFKPVVDKPKKRVADAKFWLAAAAVIGTTVLDVESTHRCVSTGTCREGNPIFGSRPTRARMYGIKLPVAGLALWSTHWWKKSDMKARDRYEKDLARGIRWDKPYSGWYLIPVVFSGITGGAAIHNYASSPKRAQPGQTATP